MWFQGLGILTSLNTSHTAGGFYGIQSPDLMLPEGCYLLAPPLTFLFANNTANANPPVKSKEKLTEVPISFRKVL